MKRMLHRKRRERLVKRAPRQVAGMLQRAENAPFASPTWRRIVASDCCIREGHNMALTLENLLGRVGDLDSPESIPVPRYGQIFGQVGERFIKENKELWDAAERITQFRPEDHITVDRADDAEINQKNVWELKGQCAPGAIDMDRRPAVMDEMGINRQLIFPMMGVFAWIQALGGGQIWMPLASPEQVALGHEAVDAYNEWAGMRTKKSDRMRMVGLLLSGAPDMTPELL